MFTGIIETMGKVMDRKEEGTNVHFHISAPAILPALRIDQSISHNGVCLTVTDITENGYWVTAIEETLKKTNFFKLKVGDSVNLERSMQLNGRFDGHIVQGHTDQVGICESISDQHGSWLYTFIYEEIDNITVEKGSICVNGISLTVVNSQKGKFSVAIIPYTFENTNLKFVQPSDSVNLEFDIIGKYLKKLVLNTN